MLFISNLSVEEEIRYNGCVRRSKMEEIVDRARVLDEIGNCDGKIIEAMGQFPAEDFLSDIQTRLGELLGKVRGNNREELQGIIEALSDVAQCTFNAADYGRSELNDALNAIRAAQA